MSKNTEKEILALQAQIAALQEKKNDEIRAEMQKLGKVIDGLPKSLGVENMDGVVGLIRRHMKSPLGTVDSSVTTIAGGERKPRVILDETDKVAIVARCLKGGPENQRSKVLADYAAQGKSVVYGTLQNWMSDANLTAKAKALNAGTAPVVETPAVAAA